MCKEWKRVDFNRMATFKGYVHYCPAVGKTAPTATNIKKVHVDWSMNKLTEGNRMRMKAEVEEDLRRKEQAARDTLDMIRNLNEDFTVDDNKD